MSLNTTTDSFTVGEFQITPSSHLQDAGHHTASLCISREGVGRTTQHTYSFRPEFKTRHSAMIYAAVLGHYWMLNPDSGY